MMIVENAVNRVLDRLVPRYNTVPAFHTPVEKALLYLLARLTTGTVFVELGSYKGGSACFIASAIQHPEYAKTARIRNAQTRIEGAKS